jgi:Clp amino terminal domain, pathogenicity island component
VLELTFREALRMGHNYIGTEHILLALAEFENGTRVLADLGIDKAAAEAHITAAVAAALAVREQKQQAGRRSGLPGYPGVSHRGSRSAGPTFQPLPPEATESAIPNLRPPPAPQIIPICTPTRTTRPLTPSVHIGGYARALKSRRQLRYVIRLSALLAELCRIVHR